MHFLNPFLLFGASAISVPILIHLLSQRRVKRVVWAAMRFLQTAVQQKQKKMNLEDLLLLLLRCLFLILLALALARPAFKKGGLGFGGAETVVIALDNSYSMSATDGVTSRFDRAKKAAEQVIDSLPGGSRAAVFLVSDVVRAAIPLPTHDLNLARKIIRDAPLSGRGTELDPVIKQALDTLAAQPDGAKSFYLLTDGQAAGWKNFAESRALLDQAHAAVTTRIILAGEEEGQNLGVSDLRLDSPLAAVGESLRFSVEVTNYGTADANSVQVSLSVDGDPPAAEGTLERIAPGAASRLSLFAKLRDPGFHTVAAQITSDRLPADDRRTMAVRALAEISVLLVDGEPGYEPRESEVFYLRNALVPVPQEQRDSYFIKTKTIRPEELESTKLADFDAVVLANVADVSEAACAAFEKYLRRGGGLIIFPGAKVNAAAYNERLLGMHAFLPAALGEIRGVENSPGKFFTLQTQDLTHPIVSLWNDPAVGSLGSSHFYRAFALQPTPAAKNKDAGEPATVLKYADGTPAVMERDWSFGRVVLFSSTADMAWNDLPANPNFLPLIHRTLGRIVNRSDERLNIAVGAPFVWPCEPDLLGKDAAIRLPGGDEKAKALSRVEMTKGLPLLRFEETDSAGAYAVNIAGDTPLSLKFAAQSNPRESALAQLGAGELAGLGAVAQVIHASAEMNLRAQFQRERTGTELWALFASLALLCAGIETVLGHLFSRTK